MLLKESNAALHHETFVLLILGFSQVPDVDKAFLYIQVLRQILFNRVIKKPGIVFFFHSRVSHFSVKRFEDTFEFQL